MLRRFLRKISARVSRNAWSDGAQSGTSRRKGRVHEVISTFGGWIVPCCGGFKKVVRRGVSGSIMPVIPVLFVYFEPYS